VSQTRNCARVLAESCLRRVHNEIHDIRSPGKPCSVKHFKVVKGQGLAKGIFC